MLSAECSAERARLPCPLPEEGAFSFGRISIPPFRRGNSALTGRSPNVFQQIPKNKSAAMRGIFFIMENARTAAPSVPLPFKKNQNIRRLLVSMESTSQVIVYELSWFAAPE